MEGVPHTSPSLIRNALDNEERVVSGQAVPEDQSPIMVEYGTAEETPLRRQSSRIGIISSTYADSIFSVEPSLASVFGGSYGTTYASRGSHASPQGSSTRQPARIFNEERLKTASGLEQERDPLLVKQIEEDGVTFNIVVGRSTLPQTIFNSVNVLIGVGLLSLPLGLRYSGWVIGLVFFAFAVVATRYTATILAKCLDVDNSLVTFSDLAYVSFGSKARIATCLLFTVELVAACVALIILFADSLDALFPGHGIVAWKLICCLLLIPLSFLPLRLLSFTSVLGIFCCLGSTVYLFRRSGTWLTC
jgi:vesicular inhibitory amino acid transporter